MRLIDSDRLLTDKMKSKYYHLQNGDTAIPIIDIEHAPTIEAIPKADYENRLKADLEAILTDLKLEIEELENPFGTRISGCSQDGWKHGVKNCDFVIQQKINALKGE